MCVWTVEGGEDMAEQAAGMNDPAAWDAFVTHAGRVTAVVPFGAFVEIAAGVVGLLPKGAQKAAVNVGDTLTVRIAVLDDANRRVSLIAV
jgi:hypothetical protein